MVSYRILKALNILIIIGIVLSFLNIVTLTIFYFTDLSEYGLNFKMRIGVIEAYGEQLDFSVGVFVTLIINILLRLVLLILARKIISNLMKNQIFIKGNYKIIRNTSFIFVIMAISDNIPHSLVITKIVERQNLLAESINSSFSLNYGFLIVAITLFVFSLIFKEGIRIAEENKFTV